MTQTENEIDSILKSFKPINKLDDTKIHSQDEQPQKLHKNNFYDTTESDEDDSDLPEEESDFENDIFDVKSNENSDEDDELYDSFEPFPKPSDEINSGLTNIENSCFLSSAIQMVFQIPFLNEVLTLPLENIKEIAISLSNLFYEVKYSNVSIIPFDFFFCIDLKKN